MPSIEQLQYLLKLAEHKNFSRAAEAACISQPALTKSIRQLEELYGVPLFDRRKEGVAPTPHGEIIINRVRGLVGAFEASKRDIRLLANLEVGELRIGTGPYVATRALPKALARLIDRYPGLRFKIEIDNPNVLVDMILRSEIDLYIGAISAVSAPKDVEVTLLPSEDIVVFCRKGHPLLGKKELSVEDFNPYPVIGPTILKRLDAWVKDLFGGASKARSRGPFRLALECDDYSLILSVVQESDCISAMPRSILRPHIDRGALVELPIAPGPSTDLGVVHLRDRTLPPVARILIDEIRAALESEVDTCGKDGKSSS